MWLDKLMIRNFRAIEDITITFNSKMNVIVGPNATGKTTILEAVRIAKSLLAPRTLQETQQTLISLGAVSPHLPQQINVNVLARDPSKPIHILCEYQLTPDELQLLPTLVAPMAQSVVNASLGNGNAGQLALISYLSSPQGKDALEKANKDIQATLTSFRLNGICKLELMIDGTAQTISGTDQISQIVFTAMEARLPPHQTLFSYFPADRALPPGEAQIQIGSPEAQGNLESHNSQPQMKYHRLKTTVVNHTLFRNLSSQEIQKDFEIIFAKLLSGKELVGIEANHLGLVNIKIRDKDADRTFDIDSLSSGEKACCSHSLSYQKRSLRAESFCWMSPNST